LEDATDRGEDVANILEGIVLREEKLALETASEVLLPYPRIYWIWWLLVKNSIIGKIGSWDR